MPWEMHDKEFESVSGLSADERYAYFIKKVADFQEVWSLWSDGWVMMGDEEGHECVPVWPHPRFASACAVGEWAGYEARLVELSPWMEKWIPGIQKDGRHVAVFPLPAGKNVVVTPARLESDLEEELAQYE